MPSKLVSWKENYFDPARYLQDKGVTLTPFLQNEFHIDTVANVHIVNKRSLLFDYVAQPITLELTAEITVLTEGYGKSLAIFRGYIVLLH